MANGDAPQQLSPAEFSAKLKAKYPAYKDIPDDQLVTKVLAKYPQYGSQIRQATSQPIQKNSVMRANPETSLTGALMSTLKDPFKAGDITTPIESYTQEGRAEHPILSRVGDVTRGAKELMFGGQEAGKPMGTSSGIANNPVTTAMTLAPGGAEVAANVERFAVNKVEPLARLNKIMGVGAKEIRVGGVPESLDEFASNPARGVLKAGVQEKQLAKMNPLERLSTLTEVRNNAGTKLDEVLNAHPDKAINVQKVVEGVFKDIPDPKLVKQSMVRLQQILSKAGINKPLSQLTPMEARTVQRGLDDFANFSSGDTAKSFRDVATSLRRGISKATRQAIPETAELDQDYGDLAGAVKAVRNQANKYARTVPESKLRKMAPYIAGSLGAGGAGAAAMKYLLPSGPK
jgi:hypothetical protein